MENHRRKSISLSEKKLPNCALSLNQTKSNIIKTDLKKILFKTPSKKSSLQLNSSKKNTPNNRIINDRFIPTRIDSNMEIGYHLLHSNTNSTSKSKKKENNNDLDETSDNEASNDSENQIDTIKRRLISDTCNGIQEKSRVLNLYHNSCNSSNLSNFSNSLYASSCLDNQYQIDKSSSSLNVNSLVNSVVKKQTKRFIPTSPERILDAPDYRNDYYLNLIDWSSQNELAVALNKDMYIWNAASGEISQLFAMDEQSSNYICSTAWIQGKGNVLAVGNSKNIVELWDVNRQVCLREMRSHTSRVGALSWNHHILSSGSRSGQIHHHDVRVAQHHVGTMKLHEQEVCGLKWSLDGRHLASGANDNLAAVWDANFSLDNNLQPLHVFREHKAAVKALAWCPWKTNVLATGGGTADGHIKLWNLHNGNLIHSQDSKSQISCLLWSKHYKELISSHGYELNQLTIWRYPDMSRVCDLTGHSNRVLMMCMSPDQQMVASVGADETLRLWKCFSFEKTKSSIDSMSALSKNPSHTSLSRCIR